MIIRNIDFPDRAVKEFVGEQAMIIDNLTETLKQREAYIKALESTIDQIKSKKRKPKNG